MNTSLNQSYRGTNFCFVYIFDGPYQQMDFIIFDKVCVLNSLDPGCYVNTQIYLERERAVKLAYAVFKVIIC